MKLYRSFIVVLFIAVNSFASNVPGAFGVKIGAARPCNFPGVCVFYQSCLEEYQERNPSAQLLFPDKDESNFLCPQAKIALKTIVKTIPFVADDLTPLTVNEYGKIPGLIQTASYKTWLKVLKDQSINDNIKNTDKSENEVVDMLMEKYIELTSSTDL